MSRWTSTSLFYLVNSLSCNSFFCKRRLTSYLHVQLVNNDSVFRLLQAWPFQRNYVLREARITEQSKASICVYKAYTYFILFVLLDKTRIHRLVSFIALWSCTETVIWKWCNTLHFKNLLLKGLLKNGYSKALPLFYYYSWFGFTLPVKFSI